MKREIPERPRYEAEKNDPRFDNPDGPDPNRPLGRTQYYELRLWDGYNNLILTQIVNTTDLEGVDSGTILPIQVMRFELKPFKPEDDDAT